MKKTLAISAFLLGAALAGPANNSLVVGTSQEPPNILDYWNTNNLAISSEINGFMDAALVKQDDDGELIAEIATRVPTLGNGDYKIVKNANGDVVRNSVTYTIRKDAKWSDGTPIKPADFQFWLKVQNDDRVPVPQRSPWDRAKITVSDADTFTITYEPPYLFAVVNRHAVLVAGAAATLDPLAERQGERGRARVYQEWRLLRLPVRHGD